MTVSTNDHTAPAQGLVDWLLACPEKEYFIPVESESTDTLRQVGFNLARQEPTLRSGRPASRSARDIDDT